MYHYGIRVAGHWSRLGSDVFVGTMNRLGCPTSDYTYMTGFFAHNPKKYSARKGLYTSDTPRGVPPGNVQGMYEFARYELREYWQSNERNLERNTRYETNNFRRNSVTKSARVSEAKGVYIRVLTRHYLNTVPAADETLPKRSGNDSKRPRVLQPSFLLHIHNKT